MSYTQGKYPVLEKKAIAKGIFNYIILCPQVANEAKCGQFVHISVPGHTLRRPVSICGIDKENGTIRIVFEVRGKGTEEISKINAGETIDMLAPLGHGFTMLSKDKKVICIGGGIGTPPMYALAKYYGNNATVISGFRNSSIAILQEDFKKAGANAILCTDDGSAGKKGFVTDALKECLANEKPDMIYACGPRMMLMAVSKIAEQNNIETEVSLEERMGCGIGACLVCACKVNYDGREVMSHVCQNGPVYNSKEVVW